jgi:chitodextrinase
VHPTKKRRLTTMVTAGLLALGAAAVSLIIATPASAAVICEQFGTTVAGNYVIMNNRWGTSATQCINTTANGFQITQQDGVGNTSGAPTAYPAIYLGCHYSNCSPGSPLPRQISQIGSAPGSISVTFPGSGTWNSAYDVWLNADTNVSGVQDTEIMIWLNRQGPIQPIGSQTGTANLAGRSWAVWTGSNGQNNVVSYLFTGSAIASFSFDLMEFVRDTLTRGSQYGTTSWYLTSVQAGFEPWQGGVGLAVNSFSQTIQGGTQNPQVPGTPGAPSCSTTTNSASLSWSASSGTVSQYQIERATGASSTAFSQVGTSTSTSFTNTGLANNTTYRYRVRANNSAGNSAYSPITNCTTGGSTTQPPGTPGTLTGSATNNSASLSWGASSGTVTQYQIERATGATSTTFTQVGTSTTTSFTNTGLAANTTYRYRVRATNSAGNSGYTNILNLTTGGGTQTNPVGGCSAAFSVTGTPWSTGFQGSVNVTNTGSSAISSWRVVVSLGNGSIQQVWGGRNQSTSNPYTVINETWNGNLGPNATTNFGFIANATNAGAPVSVTCSTP